MLAAGAAANNDTITHSFIKRHSAIQVPSLLLPLRECFLLLFVLLALAAAAAAGAVPSTLGYTLITSMLRQLQTSTAVRTATGDYVGSCFRQSL